jgi:RNA polymerase sigma-70 factor, ECF subfamily
MTHLTDIELYQRAVDGETGALERLIRDHYPGVYRLAYKWCGIQQDAEDIAQEVFVRMVRKLHTFNRTASVNTWLYRITLNTARDFHRKNASRRKHESAFAVEEGCGNPVPCSDARTEAKRIYRAIDRLPEKQKSAVLLVFGEGLSHKEAARVLKCSESTVSWRVFMARKRLKKLLNE